MTEQTNAQRLAEIRGDVSGWRSAQASVTSRGYGFSLTNNDADDALTDLEALLSDLEARDREIERLTAVVDAIHVDNRHVIDVRWEALKAWVTTMKEGCSGTSDAVTLEEVLTVMAQMEENR